MPKLTWKRRMFVSRRSCRRHRAALHVTRSAGTRRHLICSHIVSRSSPVPIVDAAGHGPLHFACARDTPQNLEVLECLLHWHKQSRHICGSTLYVDLADQVKGCTPLHVAASAGASQCLRLLLECSSSSSHARRADAFTPLHAAAAAGHHACCRSAPCQCPLVFSTS